MSDDVTYLCKSMVLFLPTNLWLMIWLSGRFLCVSQNKVKINLFFRCQCRAHARERVKFKTRLPATAPLEWNHWPLNAIEFRFGCLGIRAVVDLWCIALAFVTSILDMNGAVAERLLLWTKWRWIGRRNMSAPKWLPKDLQSSYHLFGDLEQMVTTFRCLGQRFTADSNLKKSDIKVSVLWVDLIRIDRANISAHGIDIDCVLFNACYSV